MHNTGVALKSARALRPQELLIPEDARPSREVEVEKSINPSLLHRRNMIPRGVDDLSQTLRARAG
eukprot:11219057-Lingulodinium_polyedra.AAC.1